MKYKLSKTAIQSSNTAQMEENHIELFLLQ